MPKHQAGIFFGDWVTFAHCKTCGWRGKKTYHNYYSPIQYRPDYVDVVVELSNEAEDHVKFWSQPAWKRFIIAVREAFTETVDKYKLKVR